jgi:hypothetical protein
MARVERRTVDLSAHPDLVVVYLGMRVNAVAGLKRLLGLGPQIAGSVKAKPDGLLLHEDMIFSLFPLHIGMRQYWRDPNRIANGGRLFCAIPEALVSGTKPMRCAAALRQSTMTCHSLSG